MLFNSEKLNKIYRCFKQQKEVDFMTTIKTIVNAIANIIIDNNNIDIDNIVNTVATDNNVSVDVAKMAFLISAYHSISATDNYIIVATDKNNDMYMNAYTMNDLLDFDCFNTSYDSHNKSTSLRLKVSNTLKKDILNNGIKIADNEKIEFYKKSIGLNNGQLAEQFVKMFYGVAYQRDNLAFYYFGDMTVNYTTYQIKSHKATFCNELQVKNYVNKYGFTKQHKFNKYIPTIDDTTKIIDTDTEFDKILDKWDLDNKCERYYTLCNDNEREYLINLYNNAFSENDTISFIELKQFAKLNNLNFNNLCWTLSHIDD